MTDRNDIITQIEELLGSEGSWALAESMLLVLEKHGYVEFDGHRGYALALPEWNDDGAAWNALLLEADGECPACGNIMGLCICEPQSGSLRSAARQAVIESVAERVGYEHKRNFHRLHVFRDGSVQWSEHRNQSDDIIDSGSDQFAPVPSVACVGTGSCSCNCDYCSEVYSAVDEAYAIEKGQEYDKAAKYADSEEAIADAVANTDTFDLEADMLAQFDAIEIGYFDDEEEE